MFRSGLFLSVSGPAALLTLLTHPALRQSADQNIVQQRSDISASANASVEAMFPPRTGRPVHIASIPNIRDRSMLVGPSIGQTASEREIPRVRKPLQEGCERSISSLAGPEARRMVPGRCMT